MQPLLKSVPHETAPLSDAPGALSDIVALARPSHRRLRRRLRWMVLPMLFAAAFAGWFAWQSQPRPVSIAAPHVGNATSLVYATGFVETDHPVSVSARLTAPVLRVLVDEGDHVTRGQPLALLESDQQRAQLDQAAATARKAGSDEQRALALFEQGWATRANRDAAIAAADAARAAERSARAAVDQLVVRAGINGLVIKRDVEPGSLAAPGITLFQLGDPHHLRITATVDERDVPRVRVGQPALMTNEAWPGRVIHGHVREITPSGDPTQRAFRVRLAADEDTRDIPFGLTLEVNIVTHQDSVAQLVPATALDRKQLWVMREGRAHHVPVMVGVTGARDVQILRGLAPSDLVIIDPPADLREGDRVTARH